MDEEERALEGGAVDEIEDDSQPHEPRVRVAKGKGWVIDPGRRARWSDEVFVRTHAVEIRQIGDPVLREPAKKPSLSKAELEALVARMFASMVKAHGIGIAAPQIGVGLRVCIIDVDEAGIVAINPEIQWVSDEVEETSEGCLSVVGYYGMLARPFEARLVALDASGKRFTVEGEDLGAQCMLHETDHLYGKLYVDQLRSREDLHPIEPGHEGPISGHSRDEFAESDVVSKEVSSS